MTGQWFSPGPSVSSTNKTEPHNITEILLKVALNTIEQTNKNRCHFGFDSTNVLLYIFISKKTIDL